jgi:hypothetical protein
MTSTKYLQTHMVESNCPHCYSTDCYGQCQSSNNNRWTPGYCPACQSSARCTNNGYCHQCQDYIVNIKKKLEEQQRERERESNSQDTGLQADRNRYLDLITYCLKSNSVDLTELGGEYFFLQPDNCDYCIGSPAEQAQWHVNHINKCLTSFSKINSFYEQLVSLIERKGKEFAKKKDDVIAKIKQAAGPKHYLMKKAGNGEYGVFWERYIYDCLNSEQLAQEEQELLDIAKKHKQECENEAQRDSEYEKDQKRWKAEHEKLDKSIKENQELGQLADLLRNSQSLTELEKNYQIVKNNPLYSSNQTYFDNLYTNYKRILSGEKTELCPKCGNTKLLNDKCYGECRKEERSKEKSKRDIQQVFKLSNTTPADLDSSLWNNESSWEEHLEKLEGREEPDNFFKKIEQAIEWVIIEKKSKLEQIKEYFQKFKIKQVTWENGKIKVFRDHQQSQEFPDQFDSSNSFLHHLNISAWEGELEGAGILQIQALKK